MLRLSREFLRFCAVGTVGFVVDAGVLETLTRLAGWNPYNSRVLSFLLAASVTWLLNRRYTFEVDDQAHLPREWLRYVSLNAIGGLVNYLVYAAGVHDFDVVRSHLIIGVAAGSVAGLLVNYTASKHLVFAGAGK
ncbi:MAG: GtrA family protein [Gammaproteobacteria bacterium]